jgi:hypothetical protein
MSYAADMGAGRHKTREEVVQREREMIDRIAEQLQLRPISEDEMTPLFLGVAWGTENAYSLADILAELADQRDDEPSERLMAAARRYNERALARDKQRMVESRTLDGVKTGVVLGDEKYFPGGTTQWSPNHIAETFGIVDQDFHDPHADADPAEHTIPYGWVVEVAKAHWSLREGEEMPTILGNMQKPPRDLGYEGALMHARMLTCEIDRFMAKWEPCPGIFTERLQAVNSYLQQIENEGGGDASTS